VRLAARGMVYRDTMLRYCSLVAVPVVRACLIRRDISGACLGLGCGVDIHVIEFK
jgi:hypothetical protein